MRKETFLALDHLRLILAIFSLALCFASFTSHGQSREFLFNNGVNYLLADKEMAVKQFTRAIELDPNFSAAYFYRGLAEFKLGEYKRAIMDFDKVNQLDTTLKVIHMYKGFAYRQLGDEDNALASFTTYMEGKENLTSLDYSIIGKAKMKTGDVKGAIDDFEKALTKENNASQHYYLFLALYQSEHYKEAIDHINLAIEKNDEFYGYYLNRGNSMLMIGKFKEAIINYDYALELEPEVSDSYFLRGRALDTLNMHNSAINDFTKAISLNPYDGTYYSKRGNAKYSSGDRDAACLDWTIANNLGYYEDFDKIKSLCD